MARIRTVKPEFWADEQIASWPYESRLLYIALWNVADDEGRLRASEAYLKAQCFPYDASLNIHGTLTPIIQAGKLALYEANGQRYGFLPKFPLHQKINRPSASRLPKPPSQEPVITDSLRLHGTVTEDSLWERNREQGEQIPAETAGRAAQVSKQGSPEEAHADYDEPEEASYQLLAGNSERVPNVSKPMRHDGQTVWKVWVELHANRKLKSPAALGPDLKAARELSRHVEAGDVQRILSAFIDDTDGFLEKQGHALRLLPGRLNAYQNGAGDPVEALRQKVLRGEA